MIADLVGKGGHVRTVPMPTWVKAAVDAWTTAADITEGPVFRAINKAGRVWGDGMSTKVLWDVVRAAAARAGIDKLAPHDLRRTCARLCHLAGGEREERLSCACWQPVRYGWSRFGVRHRCRPIQVVVVTTQPVGSQSVNRFGSSSRDGGRTWSVTRVQQPALVRVPAISRSLHCAPS